MADEQSTVTSTNEEALDTEVVDLEEDDTSFDDFDDDDTEETTESGNQEDDASESDDDDDEEESDEDDGDETETAETEESDEADTDETPDEAPTEDETPAVDPKEQARLAYEQRQAEKAERAAREEALRQQQEAYIADAADEDQAALRQVQVEMYNNRVEATSNTLQNGLEWSVNNIDLFKNGTPSVQNRLVRAVENFEALYVEKSQAGDPIAVRADLREYLQAEAAAIKQEQAEIRAEALRQQKQEKSSQRARTLQTPVKAPKKPKVDPDIAAFDEEAASW